MKTLRIVLLISGLLLHTATAEPELKGSPAELVAYLQEVPKIITLTGESEIKAQADRAIVSLRVRTESKSLQEALRLNQALRARIVQVLGERGIPADRFQTAKFSSIPKHGMFSEKAKGYTVENSVKITVHDEKEFQLVANVVDGSADVHHEGVEFEHSNKEELKANAVRQAGEKVAARKKLYEGMFGANLTPRAIREVVGSPEVVATARRQYGADLSKYSVGSEVTDSRAGAFAEAQMVSSFGELIFKAQLAVDYAFEPKK